MNRFALPLFVIPLFVCSVFATDGQSISSYVLGPQDQIAIHCVEDEEISDKPVAVDNNGFINLPLVGRLKVAGLTVEQVESELSTRLKTYYKQPGVSVTIVETRSQPVSVIGSVKSPGVHQIDGHKNLIEVLSLAGGLGDDAGHCIKITRRLEWGRVPVANAVDDATGSYSIAEIDVKALMEARNPAANIMILPQDVISVPRAEMIYVIGRVQHSGGYVLRERETLSVLQALSLAGGLDTSAAPKESRILRPVSGSSKRSEIPLNLSKVMSGQAGDIALLPDDILFIPTSVPKKAFARAAEAALQVTTGLAIYRR
jgi:polysaccharide biosynthesis/export protein